MIKALRQAWYRFRMWGEGGDIQNIHFPYSAQNALYVLSLYVITNASISAFSTIVLSIIHSHVMSKNEFLHADGGLFLHPAAQIGFLAAAWDFHR